jgi:RecA/RadA recombinase
MAKVSLDKALKHIRTTLGLGNEEENAAALKIRAVNEVEEFEYLLTNIPQLDWAFSKNGGIPLGTIMEIFGKHGSGKTYLSQIIAREAQKMGKNVLFCDVEGAFVRDRSEEIGIIFDDSFVVANNFKYGERVWELVHAAQDTGYFDVIIIDSIGAMFSKKELELDDPTKEPQMMVRAKMNKRNLGKCLTKINSSPSSGKNTLIILINHVIATGELYGAQKATPGGDGIKYYSHIRCEVVQRNKKEFQIYNESGERIGTKANCIIWKARMNKPDQSAEFPIYFQKYDEDDAWLQFMSFCQEYEQIRFTRNKYVYPWDYTKKKFDSGERGIYLDTKEELQDFLLENQEFIDEIVATFNLVDADSFKDKLLTQLRVEQAARFADDYDESTIEQKEELEEAE